MPENNYSVPFEFGFFQPETVANPGAGSQWLFLYPNHRRYKLVSCRFTLTTSAVVNNRNTGLIFSFGGNDVITIPQAVVQPASTSFKYQYMIGTYINALLPSNNLLMSLPADLIAPGNMAVRTETVNLDVGDSFTDIELIFSSWIERTV